MLVTSVCCGLFRRFQVNFGLKWTRLEHVGLLFKLWWMLDKLQQRLLDLSHGHLENDWESWVPEAVLARVLAEGVVVRPDPRRVLYQIGIPLECHANALNYSLLGIALPRRGSGDPRGGVPWFGFRLIQGCWWCHSFVVDGGLLIDSAPPSAPALYFAFPGIRSCSEGCSLTTPSSLHFSP
jgi:hypothetical protein